MLHASASRERRLLVALVLNAAIVAFQLVAGIVAHSLGLLADAGHNLADVAAIVISIYAVRLARRPATARRSFGFHRSTVLAAQANAAMLLVVTALVAYEAIRRLTDAHAVRAGLVVVVALVATVANVAAAAFTHERHHGQAATAATGHASAAGHAPADGHDHADRHDHSDGHGHGGAAGRDLNMASTTLHLAGDAAASLGVAIAGAIMLATGQLYWLDPAISLLIAALIAYQAYRLLREAAEVLLESTPATIDTIELAAAIEAVDGVEAVHDLHVWALSSEVSALSAHVVLDGHPTLEEAQLVGRRVKAAISAPFAIVHATFELECEACQDDGSWCAIDAIPGRRA